MKRAFLALAALFAFAFVVRPGAPVPSEMRTEEEANTGEALLHGVPTDGVSSNMPLTPVVLAVVRHLPVLLRRAASGTLRAAILVLAWRLGLELGGSAAGVLAALGTLCFTDIPPQMGEGPLSVLLLLAVANVLCWRAVGCSTARSAILGLVVGASLLVKSPLFLFPGVLAVWDRFGARGRRRWDAWAAAAVAAAILSPWIVMNARLHHRFIPFEDGRAETNIIAGAFGLVQTAEGDLRLAAGLRPGESLLFWAAGEMLRHPVRSLWAVAQRLAFAAWLHPVLATLAALGLWWGRASDRRRAVGLLAAYYVGVHCLMAVEARYLDPAWPLAAGLGAAAITDWLGGGRAHRPSMASVWLTVVPVGALVALCLVLVTAYPGRTAVGAVAFDRALARQPREAWLWRQKGFFELGQGRAKEAVSDLRAAAVLDPEEAPAFQLEWAAWAAGEPPLDIALVQADASRPRVGLLHSLQALERGEAERAVAEFQRARAAWQASGCFSRDESGRTLLAKMCPSDTRLCDVDLRSLLEIVGETRRGALARAAAEADPGLAACVDVAADHLAAVKLQNPPMGRPDLP